MAPSGLRAAALLVLALALLMGPALADGGRRLLRRKKYPQKLLWEGKLDVKSGMSNFAKKVHYSSLPPSSMRSVVADPTGNSSAPVLKVTYPKGSFAPQQGFPGGTLFYVYPAPKGSKEPIAVYQATLQYDVYFAPGFQWQWGGKLPGLASSMGCGGGADPSACWSVRIMWREYGMGEAYMYVPEGHQAENFCEQPPITVCDYRYGTSFKRGSWNFTAGAWTNIALTVRLNDVGQSNGLVAVAVNGQEVLRYKHVVYRTIPDVSINTVYFATFYGGGNDTFAAPTDTYTLFRNIRVYTADPPSGTVGASSIDMEDSTPAEEVTDDLQLLEPPERATPY